MDSVSRCYWNVLHQLLPILKDTGIIKQLYNGSKKIFLVYLSVVHKKYQKIENDSSILSIILVQLETILCLESTLSSLTREYIHSERGISIWRYLTSYNCHLSMSKLFHSSKRWTNYICQKLYKDIFLTFFYVATKKKPAKPRWRRLLKWSSPEMYLKISFYRYLSLTRHDWVYFWSLLWYNVYISLLSIYSNITTWLLSRFPIYVGISVRTTLMWSSSFLLWNWWQPIKPRYRLEMRFSHPRSIYRCRASRGPI